jgi:hypothetical protein
MVKGTLLLFVMLVLVGHARLAHGQACYADPTQKPRCFDTMVKLLRDNQVDEDKELQMCIFWEESSFCNTNNAKSSGAVGFGQLIIPSRSAPEAGAKKFWELADQDGLAINAKAMLADDGLSVKAASLYLRALTLVLKDRGKAIRNYAGQQDKDKPPLWTNIASFDRTAAKACREKLVDTAVFLVPDPSTLSAGDRAAIIAALRTAVPKNRRSPHDPALVFDPARCASE